jgi:hypothetical protein
VSVGARRNDPLLPWSLGAVLVLLACNALGLSLGVTAWYAAAREATLQGQVKWVSLAGAACVLMGLGAAVFVLVGRRTIGQGLGLLRVPSRPVPLGAVTAAADTGDLVAVPGLRLYHHGACTLARDRERVTAALAEHEAAGRTPCGFCQR